MDKEEAFQKLIDVEIEIRNLQSESDKLRARLKLPVLVQLSRTAQPRKERPAKGQVPNIPGEPIRIVEEPETAEALAAPAKKPRKQTTWTPAMRKAAAERMRRTNRAMRLRKKRAA